MHVSMHLLVLSAFRQEKADAKKAELGLNAPFGAQCFPTRGVGLWSRPVAPCLNAPFGAQCFPTSNSSSLRTFKGSSQCTFWCSVLSDP